MSLISQNDVIIKPQAGGQVEFLKQLYCDEVLFGGAAGPGKSWCLVFDALGTQYLHTELGKAAYEIPEYRAALFRRKTTQFSKLLDEGKKMYVPLGAELVYGRRGDPGPSFNFPSGARIFICHMEQEDNKEDHQGIEYQYCGFDELTQFTVTQYSYLFSRLRSTVKGLNCRMRATTNPTGTGLMWVKKRFIKTGTKVFTPTTVHYFAPDPDRDIEENSTGLEVEKDHIYAKSRMFIPGKLDENKILQDADPNYKLNIISMGKKYENALLHGDWDAFGGDFFEDFDSKTMAIKPFMIPREWRLAASIDPGWSSPCAFTLHAVDFEDNVYALFTTYTRGKSPTENAFYIKQRIKTFPYTGGRMPEFIVSGRDAFAKKDLNAIIASDKTFADKFSEVGLTLEPASTERHNGWMAFKEYMRFGKWKYFELYNEALIDEIVSAPQDEKDPDDIQGKGNDPEVNDHALDEERYFIMRVYKPFKQKASEQPEWFRNYMKKKSKEKKVKTGVMSA